MRFTIAPKNGGLVAWKYSWEETPKDRGWLFWTGMQHPTVPVMPLMTTRISCLAAGHPLGALLLI